MTFRRGLLVFFAFLFLAFFLYRHGLYAFPYADQHRLQRERVFSKTDTEFFIKSLYYDRTRELNPGNYYLFRPGANGWLGLQDILFYDKLLVPGVISVALHAAVAFSFFLLFSEWIRFSGALLLSALFLWHSSGMEMVVWRHISTYLPGILFFNLGLCGWLKQQKLQGVPGVWNSVLISALFFISMLFHEITAALFPVALLYMAVLDRESFRRTWKVLGIPSLCFWLLNVSNYLLVKPPSVIGPAKFEPTLWLHFKSGLQVMGAFLGALVFPHWVQLRPGDAMADRRWAWEVTGISHTLFLVLGVLGFALFSLFVKGVRRETRTRRIVSYLLISGFLILYGGVWVGRVVPWGMRYFLHSTYYLYFVNGFALLFIALSWERLRTLPIPRGRGVLGIALMFVVYHLIASYHRIQDRVLEPRAQEQRARDVLERVYAYFKEHPEECYAGALGKDLQELIPHTMFYRVSCTYRKASRPVTVRYGLVGRLIFEPLPIVPMEELAVTAPVTTGSGEWIKERDQFALFNFDLDPRNEPRVRFADGEFSGSALGIEIENPEEGGIVFGYHNPKNYLVLLVLRRHGVGVMGVKNGVLVHPFPLINMGIPSLSRIEVRWILERAALLVDGVIVGELDGVTRASLNGLIGVIGAMKQKGSIRARVESFRTLSD